MRVYERSRAFEQEAVLPCAVEGLGGCKLERLKT